MAREWYIAKSKLQKETWLSTSLAGLGVEVFYPRIVAVRRCKKVSEPLFPTYLFCSFDPQLVNWPSIRWAPGLSYFLGVDGQPTSIPADVIEYIKQRAEAIDLHTTGVGLLPGQRVTVMRGPFAGLEGIFEKNVGSRQRCRILLQVVGRLSPVEVSGLDLEPARPLAI